MIMKKQNTRRLLFFIFIAPATLSFIGWVFWMQELRYAQPTPIPSNFIDVKAGSNVDLQDYIPGTNDKPTLLHFFNFNCPCSRFNMKDFESLANRFGKEINFLVVIQSEDKNDLDRFKRKYDLNVHTILDTDGGISDRCGIYVTPQGVLLDRKSTIYFKGNYNVARYCTKKETKFVELAITHLLKNEPLPLSLHYALTEPYGCTLPSDEPVTIKSSVFNLF
jgi:hypothetical protein